MNVRSLIYRSDTVYMDTATLMNPVSLNNFINRYKNIFISCDRKIIVPDIVYLELLRHADSLHIDKAEKAEYALSEIVNNQDLFLLESACHDEEDMEHAFADPELLLRLTRDRRYKRQLLITNDRDLSKDAFELNSFQSFKGKDIAVCYVNYHGYLNPSNMDLTSSSEQDVCHENSFCDQNLLYEDKKAAGTDNAYIYIGISLASFALGVGATLLGINLYKHN